MKSHRSRVLRSLIVCAVAVSLSGCEWLFPDDYEGNCPERYQSLEDVRDAIRLFMSKDTQARKNLLADIKPGEKELSQLVEGCTNCLIMFDKNIDGQPGWKIVWEARGYHISFPSNAVVLVVRCSGRLQYVRSQNPSFP